MANYHLQFDDNDVKNGLLNVDADGCLKGVSKPKVLVHLEFDADNKYYINDTPVSALTMEEAYDICSAAMPNLWLKTTDESKIHVTAVRIVDYTNTPLKEKALAFAVVFFTWNQGPTSSLSTAIIQASSFLQKVDD